MACITRTPLRRTISPSSPPCPRAACSRSTAGAGIASAFGYAAYTHEWGKGRHAADTRLFFIEYDDFRHILKTDNRPLTVRAADLDNIRIDTFGGHSLHAFKTSAGTARPASLGRGADRTVGHCRRSAPTRSMWKAVSNPRSLPSSNRGCAADSRTDRATATPTTAARDVLSVAADAAPLRAISRSST